MRRFFACGPVLDGDALKA